MNRLSRVVGLLLAMVLLGIVLPMPARANMSRPTWSVGDYWEYALSGPGIGTVRFDVQGLETVTINGIPYPCYRTLFQEDATSGPAQLSVSGPTWFRVSDLALVKQMGNGTITIFPTTYTVSIDAAYDPPSDLRWPFTTGQTWTTRGWFNATTTINGNPATYDYLVDTAYQVYAEQSVTVPAGTFMTTPLNGTSPSGAYNLTYWSPTAGNAVRIVNYLPGNPVATLSLTSYLYQGATPDTTPPTIADVAAQPPVVGTGGTVTILANITDNVAVSAAMVEVTRPDATTANLTMSQGSGNQYTQSAAWTQTGTHTFTIWASDPSGNWASASGSFRVDGSPSVALLSPNGGESWSGGSTHPIDYVLDDPDDPMLTVDIEWSSDGGATWMPILLGDVEPIGAHTPAWTVPSVDTTSASVRVCAADGVSRTCDASDADFAIDSTPPQVLSTVPVPGATNVPLASSVVIVFSETMAVLPTDLAFSLSPYSGGLAFVWSTTTYTNDTVTVNHSGLASCTMHTPTVSTGARDASDPGNALASAYAWTFQTACAPVVQITRPAGGEVWSGGSSRDVRFQITDDEPSVMTWINLSTNGGGSFSPLVAGTLRPTGVPLSVPVTMPVADAPVAIIRVTARDSTGLEGFANSLAFAIDATRPNVSTSSPLDGATNVGVTAPFSITFTEAMNLTAAENSITLSPTAGTLGFSWSGDTVTVTHSSLLAANTLYTLSAQTSAKDASDPGNALLAPWSITFRTGTPIVADAGGPYSGRAGDTLILDGSGSTGAIVNYTWRIDPPAGGPFYVYGQQPSFTFLTAGTYQIALTVRDATANADTATTTATIMPRDTTGPTITHTPHGAVSIAEPIPISCTVTDDDRVADVRLLYIEVDGTARNVTMALSGGTYSFTIPGQPDVGTVGYRISAVDPAGNWAVTSSHTFAVRDTTPPAIVHTPPGPVAANLGLTITATVTDPDGPVQSVRLIWTDVGGVEHNVTMTPSGGVYAYTIPAQNAGGTIRYRIYATDDFGNGVLTQEYGVSVQSPPGVSVGAIAIVAVVLAAAVLLALFLMRRKKRKAEPKAER